jgi:hypothetical protein
VSLATESSPSRCLLCAGLLVVDNDRLSGMSMEAVTWEWGKKGSRLLTSLQKVTPRDVKRAGEAGY